MVGGPRFYERAEVRDLLSYLRVVANPADGVSLARMLGAPKRGLGPGCVSKLEAYARAFDLPIADAILRPDEVSGITPGQRATVAASGALVADVRQRVEAGAPLDRILEEVLDRSGLRESLEREGTFEAQGRIENLEEMVRVAAEYDTSERRGDARGLPRGDRPAGRRRHARRVRGRRSTLMTIHNAKGLEFDTVVITGLEEGLFPHSRSDTPGDPRGGATPLLRRAHAGPAPPGADARREPGDARRSRLPAAVAVPRRAPARRSSPARRAGVARVRPFASAAAGGAAGAGAPRS